jgi:hypothetical protein
MAGVVNRAISAPMAWLIDNLANAAHLALEHEIDRALVEIARMKQETVNRRRGQLRRHRNARRSQ